MAKKTFKVNGKEISAARFAGLVVAATLTIKAEVEKARIEGGDFYYSAKLSEKLGYANASGDEVGGVLIVIRDGEPVIIRDDFSVYPFEYTPVEFAELLVAANI